MENLIKGIANFEGDSTTNMLAYCDPRDTWNGWARPYIHHKYVYYLIQMISGGDSTYTRQDGNILVVYGDDYSVLIKPTLIEGEEYYCFGNEGICFDFEPTKNDGKARALITDIEGLIYDEDVEELTYGEVVEVLTINKENEFVWVLSGSGVEHGIDIERIILI
jgi:hypothetical protein